MIKAVAMRCVSSNIEDIIYHFEAKILEIWFINETAYRYKEVPQEVFMGFFETESIGKYFCENIKKKDYKYERIK